MHDQPFRLVLPLAPNWKMYRILVDPVYRSAQLQLSSNSYSTGFKTARVHPRCKTNRWSSFWTFSCVDAEECWTSFTSLILSRSNHVEHQDSQENTELGNRSFTNDVAPVVWEQAYRVAFQVESQQSRAGASFRNVVKVSQPVVRCWQHAQQRKLFNTIQTFQHIFAKKECLHQLTQGTFMHCKLSALEFIVYHCCLLEGNF